MHHHGKWLSEGSISRKKKFKLYDLRKYLINVLMITCQGSVYDWSVYTRSSIDYTINFTFKYKILSAYMRKESISKLWLKFNLYCRLNILKPNSRDLIIECDANGRFYDYIPFIYGFCFYWTWGIISILIEYLKHSLHKTLKTLTKQINVDIL